MSEDQEAVGRYTLDPDADAEWIKKLNEIDQIRADRDAADKRLADLSAEIVDHFADSRGLVWTDADGNLRDVDLRDERADYYPDKEGLALLEAVSPTLWAKVTKRVLDTRAFNAAVDSGIISAELLTQVIPHELLPDGTAQPVPARVTRPTVIIKKPRMIKSKEKSA